jgi:hypothetical protein
MSMFVQPKAKWGNLSVVRYANGSPPLFSKIASVSEFRKGGSGAPESI